MRRFLVLIYGFSCYAASISALAYLFAFTGNIGIEKSIDSAARLPWSFALAIDLGLLLLFFVQHSAMARSKTKAFLSRLMAPVLERSSYVLLTSLSLLAIFVAWQPMDFELWHVESPVARGILYGMFVFGWLTVIIAIALTNHFDLFGIRQIWSRFRRQRYRRLPFTTRWLYRYVRHPLYLGWLFAFWSAPVMTIGHLLFATAMTLYIVIAIPWEENDLVAEFGTRYLDYRRRVPKLIPSIPLRADTDTFVLDHTGQHVGPADLKSEFHQ